MLRDEAAVELGSLDVDEKAAVAGFWVLLDAVVLHHDWLFFTTFTSHVCLSVDSEMCKVYLKPNRITINLKNNVNRSVNVHRINVCKCQGVLCTP